MTGPALSRMEWLVMCCWVAGMTGSQTAASLTIRPHTAQSYLRRARRKMGAPTRLTADPGPAPRPKETP